MVGWSRRNAESDREARKARAKYKAWFDSLTPEKQEEERQRQAEIERKEKSKLIVTLILAFLLMFVGWPLVAIQLGKMRWQAEWDAGRVVSQDTKQVCKEVEYCAPCSPIHHWHKKVFCEPIDRK